MQVEQVAVSALIPYAKNSRTHSDAQIAQIAASIREFGFTNPLLIDASNSIIAGHGRLLAARMVGMSDVPCIRLTHLTKSQQKALIIADNKLALNAGWDNDLLAIELGDLKLEGFDLDLTGFNNDELAALEALGNSMSEGLTDEDAVPETPTEPVTVLGDLWTLGNHRLLCGDSTSIDAVERLMDGKNADICFSSPPYGQQRNYETGITDWLNLMKDVYSILPISDSVQVLVNLGLIHKDGEWIPYWDGWIDFMRESGWRRFGWYVWDQGPGLPGDWNGRLAPSHEFIFHFNKVSERARKTKASKHAGKKLSGGGLREADGTVKKKSGHGNNIQDHKVPDSVVRVMRHKGGLGNAGSHPAPFPVELPAEILSAFSDPGDLAYEPFTGSGTQIIAAQRTGRKCFGMELATKYCDVSLQRWADFTGREPVREDGAKWSDLKKPAPKPEKKAVSKHATTPKNKNKRAA